MSAAPPVNQDAFEVHLDVFEGPFDLLLQLISKHKLDITEVSLSQVTDEFLAHIKKLGPDLEQTTQFLVVAATLLDLKTARLLPQGDIEDEDDLELLEARDLLFARLMQYRAFKLVAAHIAKRLAEESKRHPRNVDLEPRFAQLLPEVLISIGPHELAAIASAALAPKEVPILSLAHLHAPGVSVREQAHLMVDRLRRVKQATFRSLVADAPDTLTKVARFLAVLELFREGVLAFDQATPLGDLHLRWTGSDDAEIEVSAEFDDAVFDEYGDAAPPEAEGTPEAPDADLPETDTPAHDMTEQP
ncbi:MAG: segregation/condensation protein [Nocardioidaceae bacterium]|nr:segregation/condensation protein [Nocardioidaceae bacterium]